MTHEERLLFLKEQVPNLIDTLEINTLPKWGKMTAQHMVEHMSMSFAVANGKIKIQSFITSEEKLAAMKRFVLGETPFKENTKSPALSDDLPALRYGIMDEAKAIFKSELLNIFNVYVADENLTLRNPMFGDLNYEAQVGLITKHVKHHLNQFGLLN
jgi:hydroxymethylglutaryl-CoA reductase